MDAESFYRYSGIGIVTALATTLFSPYINIHNSYSLYKKYFITKLAIYVHVSIHMQFCSITEMSPRCKIPLE